MKTLFLHCNSIYFRPVKKAIDEAEKIDKKIKDKGVKVEDCFVIFLAIERKDNEKAIEKLLNEAEKIIKQIKVNKVVIYPYVHLTTNPASPSNAFELLLKVENAFKEKFQTFRAPFGWYKEFKLDVKGHPLAELSREIIVEGEEKYNIHNLLKNLAKVKLDKRSLSERDHRILASKMDLFSFNEVAPSMVFWHTNGLIIRELLMKWQKDIQKDFGYYEVITPQILDKNLWLVSGHWEKYKENMFLTKYSNRDFAIKPMNCPGHILLYKLKQRSYKDLPLRIAEYGVVHRQELSGVLSGMFRVIQFTQDDAHIFCREDQIEEEISSIITLIEYFYNHFNFSYRFILSTRPEKRIGKEELWDKGEEILKKVLRKKVKNFEIAEGEGAFYGPKIDALIKDSLNREWQLGTIQLDFLMPERFDLFYLDENGNKKIPVMIHRAIFGSIERFVGILLEHTNGNLPFWLSPIQCRIISVSEKYNKEALEIAEDLNINEKVRCDVDDRNISVSKKIREAEIQRIPYIITLGEKELKNQILTVRIKKTKEILEITPHKLREIFKKEQGDMPWIPLNRPYELNKRISFE
ncbi:MAG: threonine--tRNA ligase [Candidatus Pacearchaeota archaeon]